MSTGLADLDRIHQVGVQTRANRLALRRAKPLIRLWANSPDDSPGLVLRGIVSSAVSGKFRWTKNQAAEGVLRLRLDHYLAKWLISIPNDPTAKKNTVITVDLMGGAQRWSGLLKNWKAVRDAQGLRYLDVTFVDDLQFLQYMLGPPNPLLPIPVFQWPRVLPIFGPAKWAISVLILINLIRIEGNLYQPPDDPFDTSSWDSLFDWSGWQVLIKANPFDLDDSSLWAFLATRMTRMDQVIADALDDAQLVITYRRILTVDGEVSPVDGVPVVANGALVLEVVDRSGYYGPDGTSTGGGIVGGFERTLVSFASGFVEDVETTVSDSEIIWPDQYYQPGFLGAVPGYPPIVVRDTDYTSMETSMLCWSPATAVDVIVGGDNPLADQLARLAIESIGAAIGYFLGFSALGSMAADVIMPFLVGCIAAFLQWKNQGRGAELGWVHLWELFQQGAENNAWSISAIAALRAGFLASRSETSHQFTMDDGGAFLPGLDFSIGDRIGSTCAAVSNLIFVDQVEVMEFSFDPDNPHQWDITVGLAKAAMSQSERQMRLVNKALQTISNLGVHLLS